MSTAKDQQILSLEAARERAGLKAFPAAAAAETGPRVGLEPEFFPVFRDPAGAPAGRMSLRDGDPAAVLSVIDRLSCRDSTLGSRQGGPLGPWQYELDGGGRLTFEPGAQVEHSTTVHPSPAAALDDVRRVVDRLRRAFAASDAVLAAAGLDIWHDVEHVPQQLPFGRYRAQAAYYDRRGPWGGIMMRHTASLQINLDLGEEGVWQERWLAANLLSPLITASFACSPADGAVGARARVWQHLDPSRSGFPRLLTAGEPDPRKQWADAALDADVMLFRLPDGRWEPGTPGFTFADWIEDGHPEYGRPTIEDLDYHLTTLFFEVRPRGFIELRSGEAVPDHLQAAQVVLVSAAIYDAGARSRLLDRLDGLRPLLGDLWRRAAELGVHDAELAALSAEVWREALQAAERMPSGTFETADVEAAHRFMKRYTLQGRTPADTLRELQEADPARALAWAASEIEIDGD